MNPADESKIEELSPREKQIAEGVWSESPDKLIADGLHISHSTLRTHLQRICLKLDVKTRTGIAKRFEHWRTIKMLSVEMMTAGKPTTGRGKAGCKLRARI